VCARGDRAEIVKVRRGWRLCGWLSQMGTRRFADTVEEAVCVYTLTLHTADAAPHHLAVVTDPPVCGDRLWCRVNPHPSRQVCCGWTSFMVATSVSEAVEPEVCIHEPIPSATKAVQRATTMAREAGPCGARQDAIAENSLVLVSITLLSSTFKEDCHTRYCNVKASCSTVTSL